MSEESIEQSIEVVRLRRKGFGCTSAFLLALVAPFFAYWGVRALLDPYLWYYGIVFLFIPLATLAYVFRTSMTLELGPEEIVLTYALGRTRRFPYKDLEVVQLRGKDWALFRPRGALLQGFRQREFSGDFNEAVKRLLLKARAHDIPIEVAPRRAFLFRSKNQRVRDLRAWEEQVGIRAELPRAIARRRR